MTWHELCILTLLRQKGALSYERSFIASLDPLTFGVIPVKHNEDSSTQLLAIKNRVKITKQHN